VRIREHTLEDVDIPPRPSTLRPLAQACRTQPAAAGLRLDTVSSGSPSSPRVTALARDSPQLRSDPAEVSRVRGRAAFALPGAFRRDCSQRKLRPDPIGSDTCRREARRECRLERPTPQGTHVLACAHDELTGRTCLREAHQTPALELPRETNAPPVQTGAHEARLVSPTSSRARLRRRPLSRPATGARAASRAAPRRETRSAAPEVPSIDVLPHSRQGFHPAAIRSWAAFHRLSPNCGVLAAGAFAFRALSHHL